MPETTGYVGLYLQDKDGITVDSTSYKIANGAYISLRILNYPLPSVELNTDAQVKPGAPLDSSKTFLDKIGSAKYTGLSRPTFKVDVLVPVDANTNTRANYFGTSVYSATDVVPLNFYLLWNLIYVNHTYYLTDLLPNTSKPNLGLPLNILQQRTDIFNKEIFDSSKGVPVIFTSIKPNGKMLLDGLNPEDGDWWMPYTIEFMVDK
jgi:hypothetical protein